MLLATAELALLVHISQTFTNAVQWDKTSRRRVDRHRCGTKEEISVAEQDVAFSHQSQNLRSPRETEHPDFPPASCLSQHAWPCKLVGSHCLALLLTAWFPSLQQLVF